VLDTNVFISGLLSPNGVPGAILRRFRQMDFDIVTSKDQLNEIQDVLRRPSLSKALPKGTTKEVLKFLLSFKKLAKVLPSCPSLNWTFEDPGDHFLLDLIVHSKADFLVTGDRKLRELLFVIDTIIISPTEFLGRI
jgi:putative PIN family toxin of toxin-antitoxin system